MAFADSIPHRLFTRDEVARMVEAGILDEDEPLELIEGELVPVSPQGPIHANLISLLAARLVRLFGEGFQVRQGAPIDAGERSLPEPDVCVARGGPHEFADHHPRGHEVTLAIEVAKTSHTLDRAKAVIYARAGVPVYWLVDLVARRVEVYEEPQPDGRYRLVRILAGGDVLTPPGTDASWQVAELLP